MLIKTASTADCAFLFKRSLERYGHHDELSRFRRYRRRNTLIPGMITIAHSQSGTLSPTNSSFNIAVTSTTGNLLVLLLAGSSTIQATSVSDNVNSGNYTQIGSGTTTPTASQIFYFPVAATGVTTLTVASAGTTFGYMFYDLSGAATSSILNASNVLNDQTPGTANPVGPSINTTNSSAFVCAVCGCQDTITAVALPFTGDFFDSTISGAGFARITSASISTYNPSWTQSGPGTWDAVIAAFASPVVVVSPTLYNIGRGPGLPRQVQRG